MATIIIIPDLFDHEKAQRFEHVGPLIDLLQVRWPDGFKGQHVTIYLNGRLLAVENFDVELLESDYVAIIAPPKDPVTLTLLYAAAQTAGAYLVSTAFLTQVALTLAAAVITSLLAPKAKGAKAAAKAVYSIGASQNQPALGSPVPEHFGKTWFYPTYASQPYVKYINGEQYLYQIMLLSAGKLEVNDIRIGTTRADSFEQGTVEYHIVPPSVHGGVLGNIKSLYGIDEDVVSSEEVQQIDFGRDSVNTFFGKAYADDNYYDGKEANPAFRVGDSVTVLGETPSMANHNKVGTITSISGTKIYMPVDNDAGNPWYQLVKVDDGWRGWFEATPPMKTTTKIEVDFAFPNGLLKTDNDGDYRRWDAYIFVEVQPIDDTGATTGPSVRYQYIYSAASANPRRMTESITVAEGRYRVRAKRDDRDDAKGNESSKCYWTGLKAYCSHPAGTEAYGDVTLLVVTLKATRALADSAASQLVCQATRILPTVASDFTVEAPTTNVVDAFAHVFRSGSNVSDGLDMVNLKELGRQWANTNGFNFRFERESTVFDALQVVAGVHRAVPTAYARLLGMRPDRAQTYDKFLLTPEQMVRDTYSLGIKLGSDTAVDSYRVEYSDPQTVGELSVIYPLDGSVPENVNLYGCTDRATADAQAKYLWTKRDALRRIVDVTTEFDAHAFAVGDRIAILHPLMDWITSARVMDINGQVLTLDGTPVNQGLCQFKLRDEYGVPSELMGGVLDGNTLTMDLPAPFPIYGVLDGQEGTTVVLGTETLFRRSYVVSEITPSSDTIAIRATGYDGAEYAYPIPGEVP